MTESQGYLILAFLCYIMSDINYHGNRPDKRLGIMNAVLGMVFVIMAVLTMN